MLVDCRDGKRPAPRKKRMKVKQKVGIRENELRDQCPSVEVTAFTYGMLVPQRN